MIADQMLAAQSVEKRAAMWKRIISDQQSKTAVYLAEGSGVIVGFGSCGPPRTEQLLADGYDAEIEAIYVLRPSQGRGVGKALMHRMAWDLAARGYNGASLWVIRENARARRFYELLGGAVVAEREDRRAYGVLNEVAYGWRPLDQLRPG